MPSFALHGLGVSGGIAIGRAQLVSHATLEVAHYAIPAGARRRRDRAPRPRAGGSPRRARGPARRDDGGRRPGRVRRLSRRPRDDPRRSDDVGGAEADHRRAALQRRVGADAADERAGRAVRGDRGRLPARAQGGRRAGGRARPEAAPRQAGRARAGRRGAAHDPGRARSFAGRRHPVQDAPLRRLHHRPGRRDVAHGDRRAEPRRAGGRRHAQRRGR